MTTPLSHPYNDITCTNFLSTQRRKTTKTTTFEESNLPRPRLMNKNMNTNRSRNYKYRIWQCKIYNYLERPRGWKSGIYHIIM
ncbi:unnamed protein product [Brachionus calyciflorus]|uniref:Uncharacterized protein n=1 Tax=Brachionus calyciflorus TaxID=104777 RepID=A0A814JJT3_9BILA|nr:unnamed protein product [Brachionus calyciflorus]